MVVHLGRVSRLMINPQRHPKTGVYRLRKSVPEGLRKPVAAVLGREGEVRELIRSLGTRDPKKAKELMPSAVEWADGVLEAARTGARPLTVKEAHALAGVWYRRKLHEWEANPDLVERWDHWDDAMPTDGGTEHDQRDPAFDRQWQKFLRPFIPETEELLGAAGFVTDYGSKVRLAELIVERLGQALVQHRRRMKGDYRPDPLVAQFPPLEAPQKAVSSTTPAVSLRGLYADWKRTFTGKPTTSYETNKIVEMLIEYVGHDDAARINRETLLAWRKQSKEEGRTNNTWNNRLSMIGQVLRVGIEEGKLTSDPTEKLRLTRNKVKSPLPYSDEDARRILTAARLEKKPALRWAHWVMAYTGMRAGEVLQLTGGDIRNEGDIWYIAVHEDDEGKSVKTGQRRHVPIHDALIAEGFVRYAQTIAPDAPLFPEKRLDRFGRRGGRSWQLIGRWVRNKVGVTNPAYAPDHSWRHRFEDDMRAAEIDKADAEAITGRSDKSSARAYGVRGVALQRLWRAVNRVPAILPPVAAAADRASPV